MQEHTYKHRLQYILSKITNTMSIAPSFPVVIFAISNSKYEIENLCKSFSRQEYDNKILLLSATYVKIQTLAMNT